jgi:hypothetical protein
MSYQHVENLYQNQTVLLFREVWALEKIHGTSAKVVWNTETPDMLRFSPGSEKHERFVKLFDQTAIRAAFLAMGHSQVTVYGESYGGAQQGMSATYGKALKFIAFEVQVGETWLNVENAADVASKLGLEFVYYEKISTDIEAINAQRDADSVQAVRNGMGPGHKREGIVLRPLQEFVDNRGERVLAKHKRDEFKETATPREVDPAQAKILADAEAISLEYVTDMRLSHVLDKIPEPHGIEKTGLVIRAMVEDVVREAAGEIVESKEARKAIGARAAKLFKLRLAAVLGGE